MGTDALLRELTEAGVAGLTVSWADNNGIPRSRTVPISALAQVARTGIGVTTLFAVFDSSDAITYAHPGLSTPSGDTRLVPDTDRITQLAGQPALAWAPGNLVSADGTPWPYDQRGVLQRQVAALAEKGLTALAGWELEFTLHRADGAPAHHGPAYGPAALTEVDEFVASVLRDFAANGLSIHQLHAEYGPAQVEIALAATDPVSAADQQLLARQTLRAAARTHGLTISFAPLPSTSHAGNGWHLHTSLWRGGQNLLAGGPEGPGADGLAYVAGLLRDLPGVAAITAPSLGSLARLRPGFFAGAYAFWGVQNREAPLRYVPGTAFLGEDRANLELKASDASANPYLALAVVLACGAAGVAEGLTAPPAFGSDPGTWDDDERATRGVVALPGTPDEQDAALAATPRIGDVLGAELLGAFRAVR
ncbi:glutamine synthetase family protein, partial [Pseudonocardia sp. KRD291]|uniref:glutamine synthetase family protein n=1 Tax=Pseudonocardia sp. KRD291 TaxID=2792007 RepID=UPI001C49F98E